MRTDRRPRTHRPLSNCRLVLFLVCPALAALALSALAASNAEDSGSAWTGLVETAPQPAETAPAPEPPDEAQAANQAEVDTLIAGLEKETIQQSFEKLGFVDDFFDPGFMSNDPTYPHDDRNRVLSNRRVAKILQDLQGLSSDARYYWLKRYFDHYLSQYESIIARFDTAAGYTPTPGDREVFSIGGVKPGEETYDGSRYALQSLVFISGMLGNAPMWPHVKAVFLSPPARRMLDKGTIDPSLTTTLRLSPAFPTGIQADTALLFAQTLDSDAARAVGFDRDAVLAEVTPDEVYDFEIMKYKSRVTRFDVAKQHLGMPVDRSSGSYTVKFLNRKAAAKRYDLAEGERHVHERLLEAAGIPAQSATQ